MSLLYDTFVINIKPVYKQGLTIEKCYQSATGGVANQKQEEYHKHLGQ